MAARMPCCEELQRIGMSSVAWKVKHARLGKLTRIKPRCSYYVGGSSVVEPLEYVQQENGKTVFAIEIDCSGR